MSGLLEAREIVDDLPPIALVVLMQLGPYDDFGYCSFKRLSTRLGCDRALVKAAITDLRRHDLVEFASGLTTEDGEFAGSGYAASDRGLLLQGILEAGADAAADARIRLLRAEQDVAA